MDPITAALAAQGIVTLLQIYANHTGKPAGWKPSDTDWNDLEAWANRTPEQIKAEGRAQLGQQADA